MSFTRVSAACGTLIASPRSGREPFLIAVLALLAAAPARAGTLYQVGPTRPFQTLQQVAGLLTPGDEVEIDGNVTYPGGVLLQNHGLAAQKITIRGLRVNGNRPRIHGGGDGIKLDADHYVVEGLEITGDAALPTNRCLFLQGDDILVRDTVVHDCPRHGILGADGESGTVTLEHVEVHRCGSGTQYHQIYMATDNTMFPQATFRMRYSWVHDASGGNSVKSRAGRNEIHYNWIEGGFFHELDLIGADGQPAGLVREDSEVVGNVFVKSATSTGRIARIGGDGTGDSNGRFRFAHNTMLLGNSSGTAISIQDHVESLQVSDNVIHRPSGATFVVVRTAEQVGTSLHAGQNNWIASNATGLRPEWTGSVLGTNPGFTNLAGWDLTPAAGSAIQDAGLLPTSGPAGAPFPNPLTAPLYHPPPRAVGLAGSEQPRPSGGTIDIGAYERVSIVPSMTIDDATVAEGSAGNTTASFTVRLSASAAGNVTVSFATANGTATAPADYTATSGVITFPAGATTRTVPVTVIGDVAVEPDETFTVELTNVSGATLADATGVGTISDDDAAPLAGLELAHGTALTRTLAGAPDPFRVAQSPRSSYEVVVDAASGDVSPAIVERLAADQATVLQSAVAAGTGTSRTLRWQNTSASAISNQHIRVRSGECTTNCGADDTYRIRAWGHDVLDPAVQQRRDAGHGARGAERDEPRRLRRRVLLERVGSAVGFARVQPAAAGVAGAERGQRGGHVGPGRIGHRFARRRLRRAGRQGGRARAGHRLQLRLAHEPPPAMRRALLAALVAPALLNASDDRPRARDLGLRPGSHPPGPHNAITDVPGVHVGHVTLVEGDRVRTGVTAIVPHPGNVFQEKVAGAVFVGNAFGKLAGSTQVEELGTIETPVVLTNTLSVGAAVQGVVGWTLSQPGNEPVRSVNALVGETNDGGLNDIRGQHVTPAHVVEAIRAARSGPVAEGSVGAGTGTVAFGWKGGIGTSSRIVTAGGSPYTVGVLVQSNYGGDLVMAGVPVGRALSPRRLSDAREASADGSCLIVVATDAPLDARDLRRLAARSVFGLARTGSSYSHGSGDYAIAFSTSSDARYRFGETVARPRSFLPGDAVSPLFEAVLEATEEAVLNSLLRATTVTGNGRTIEAIPIDRLREVLAR